MALATLTIDINARLANIERDLGKVAHLSEQAASRMGSAFRGVASAMTALGGVVGAGSLISFIDQANSYTASLDDMAEKTGASVELLSALARVAQIGGHDLGLVETAAIKLAKGLADADEKGSAAGRALRALRLDPAQLRAMDTAEALKLVADRLNEYKDGAGKTALAMDLLGKSGAQALPFLKDLAESGDLVATTTAKQAAEAEKFEKALAKLKVQAAEAGRSLVSELIPALNKFLETANQPGAGLMGSTVANIDNAIFGRGDIKARLDEAKKQLADAEARKTAPGTVFGGGIMGAYNDAQIEKLKSVVVAYKEMYAAQVLASNSASYSNEGRSAGLRDLAYVGSDPEKRPKKPEVDPWVASQRARAKQDATAFEAEEKAIEALAEKYRAMADPLQKYREQLDEINSLRERGKLSADQAIEAEWAVNDAMDSTIDKMEEVRDKGKDAFAELSQVIDGWGKSTSAAIADVAVSGKGSLNDLGKSFVKEMMTMLIYQNIFKGLSSGLSTSFAGLFSGSAANMPKYAQGTNYVPNDGIAYLHKGEAVVPAQYNNGGGGGVTIINNTGAPVMQRQVSDGRGGRKLEVQIGEAVAAQMLVPGSAANRARRAQTMTRRG